MSLEREQSDPLPGLLSGLKQKHPNRERESGKRGVRFPLFRSSSRLWECGNRVVGDFQGLWARWETCFWFSTASMARHFHSRLPQALFF
jgi:hypothetical protein